MWSVAGFIQQNSWTLFVVITIFILSKFVIYVKCKRDAGEKLSYGVGYPKRHWLFGHLLQFSGTEDGLLRSAERSRTFPKMSIMWFGPTEAAIECYHPESVKPLLAKPNPKSTFAYKFIRPWLGNSILLSSGDDWRRKRKLLSPAFNANAVERYVDVFNDVLDTMIEKMKEGEEALEIYETVNLMTLDAVLRCCFSRKMYPQDKTKETIAFVDAVSSLNDMIIQRIMRFHLWNDFLFRHSELGKKFFRACDTIHQESEKIIKQRRTLQKDGISGNSDVHYRDFLQVLIEAKDDQGEGLTDEDIRSQVDTFLFAGHDTTSSAIAWTLYNLSKHPHFQERCVKEMEENVQNNHAIQWSEISSLRFIEQCINESMRLYPPVTGVGRCPNAPTRLCSQYTGDSVKVVPKNSNVNIRIFDLHRHPDIWSKPKEYNPERFAEEVSEQIPAYSFIPFSQGHRIIWEYELYTDKDTPAPVMKPGVILRSEKGIFIKLRKRNHPCSAQKV